MKLQAWKLTLAVGTALSLAAPASATADRIQELYRKASKEGQVAWYTTGRKAYNVKFSKWWRKKFPKVKLTILRKNSPKLIQTLEAERAAGRPRADVISVSVPYQGPLWKKKGLYAPYKPGSFGQIDRMFKDPDGYWIARATFLLLGAYNTNKIKDERQLPGSLQDMLKPEWKGRLLSTDPKTAGSGRTFYAGLIQQKVVDWDYFSHLAQQKMMFVRANGEAARMIVAGEREVAISISSHNIVVAMDKGQPIKFYVHKEGAVLNMSPMGILKASNHPNAARLLVEWQFTDEGQNQIARWAKQWSVMRHIKPPKGMPDLFKLKVIEPDLSFLIKKEKSFLNRFAKTFGRN